MALCVVVFGLQLLFSNAVTGALLYWPPLTYTEPWRMLTAAFVHSPGSFLHIVFNMYSLFIFGPILEQLLGRGRFLALYLVAAFGGSVAVLLIAPSISVVGASGAIFGLLGAFFVIQRRLGGNNIQIIIVLVLNLVLGFIIPNVAWQAHLGGLVAGAAVAFVYLQTRRPAQRNIQVLGVLGIAAVLVVITLGRLYVF